MDQESFDKCNNESVGKEQPNSDGTRPTNDATIAPGQNAVESVAPKRFGDYEILDEIARGGMGIVYKAKDSKLNRVVALKMILGGQFSSPDDRQRFRLEAESTATLDHPAIVPVYDFGEQDEQSFFAMRFIDGCSLKEKMSLCRNDNRKAAKLLATVSRAIHHAHQNAILHRDLKPANILIDGDDLPLVTDFGLAKQTSGNSDLTESGAVLGTPQYMSPEQASGRMVTTASDVYSLGAILYEMLTGQAPHQGSSVAETLMSVISNEPKVPRQIESRVDRDLELICLKAINRQPELRYGSAEALADDLENWLAGDLISVKPPTVADHIRRWLTRNRRLGYILFATMISLFFSLPILAALLLTTSTGIGGVYDYFPGQEKPWLFRIGEAPVWLSAVFNILLLFVIWPLLGFINAWVSRPKSTAEAFSLGSLTGAFCGCVVFLVLGWAFFTFQSAQFSSRKIQPIANALWVEENENREDALAKANQLFEGLVNVPETERAKVVVNRIAAEQIALGPKNLLVILMQCVGVAIPIVYGTVLAFVLLNRQLNIFITYTRYLLAWCAISQALIMTTVALSLPDPQSMISYMLSLWIGGAFVTWLLLRRWKSMPNSDVVPSS